MITPRRQTLLFLGVIGAIGWFLAGHAPADGSAYPPCLFHALTGWHCPGCGSARALHALANANLRAAFGYNVLAMFVLAALTPWGVWQAWLGVRHNRFATLALPPAAGWSIVGTIVVFTLARNLPWPPFSWLAPAG